jgi:hypothetical protein
MKSAGFSIGDRDLPLEADLGQDATSDHPLVGKTAEVSAIAGGDLLGLRGKSGPIRSVLIRSGQVVGYGVEIQSSVRWGSLKDFYTDRVLLEDIEVLTPTTIAIREALSHWAEPRTYWHDQLEGVESFCFELASASSQVNILPQPGGWLMVVQDPVPQRVTIVDCRVSLREKFWSLCCMVYPEKRQGPLIPYGLSDHWDRTFSWTEQIAEILIAQGFPWEGALNKLKMRRTVTEGILRPRFFFALEKCLAAKQELKGSAPVYPPGSLSVGLSNIRLKAATVGLSEPPTDRRPYAVLSIGTEALKSKDYFWQVLLHEALHAAVHSKGGPPHGKEFQELAEVVGLEEKYRD